MNALSHQDVQDLLSLDATPCVSLYMPTTRAGRETLGDHNHLKNLARQAETALTERGADSSEIESLLKPARERIANDEFWQHQSDGLALFLAPGFVAEHRLPESFESLAVVGPRFHITPLLPVLQGDGRYFLLAASLNKVRLFEGHKFGLFEIELDDLPESLQDALKIDEYTSALQYHTGHAAPDTSAMYHGQGASDDDVRKEDEIKQFFHRLSRALEDYLAAVRSPLVFAGVDYLFPIFRETCHYDHIVEEPLKGNPDELDSAALHERAWEIAEPIFAGREAKVLDQYGHLAAKNQASSDLEEILAACRQGQVETLLLARGTQVWGQFDEESGSVTITEDRQDAAACDLLDLAARQVITQSGQVHIVDSDRMPNQSQAAALYRYPAPASQSA